MADDAALRQGVRGALADPARFSDLALPERALRQYQRAPARAIAGSIVHGRGEQHVLVFSRQAGKDEVLAQLLAWVLVRYQLRGGGAVLASRRSSRRRPWRATGCWSGSGRRCRPG